jgi:hypothetical protein
MSVNDTLGVCEKPILAGSDGMGSRKKGGRVDPVPLKHGGPDAPSNMQWQTIEESKAKDKIE